MSRLIKILDEIWEDLMNGDREKYRSRLRELNNVDLDISQVLEHLADRGEIAVIFAVQSLMEEAALRKVSPELREKTRRILFGCFKEFKAETEQLDDECYGGVKRAHDEYFRMVNLLNSLTQRFPRLNNPRTFAFYKTSLVDLPDYRFMELKARSC